MRIAFLGNFDVDYSSETHYLKTLISLGHEVYPLQEGRCQSEYIFEVASTCDLLFWVHTHSWKTEGIERVLEGLKHKKIPTVGYHLDLWLGIEREADLYTDPYWKIDYFFSVDPKMVDLLNSNSEMPKAFFLPAGVFDQECYLGQKRLDLTHDVIFVGSKGYHPEWPYRAKLIEWLATVYGPRFAQYGGGGKGTIRGSQLNDLYASSKIVIGDTLCKDFNYPEYLSDRIFETTGRGGFLIHPYIKGMEKHFELLGSKKEVVPYEFDNFDYLKYVIDFYLRNDQLREEIRLRGHQRTKSNHTYKHRLQKMLDIVQSEIQIKI